MQAGPKSSPHHALLTSAVYRRRLRSYRLRTWEVGAQLRLGAGYLMQRLPTNLTIRLAPASLDYSCFDFKKPISSRTSDLVCH